MSSWGEDRVHKRLAKTGFIRAFLDVIIDNESDFIFEGYFSSTLTHLGLSFCVHLYHRYVV